MRTCEALRRLHLPHSLFSSPLSSLSLTSIHPLSPTFSPLLYLPLLTLPTSNYAAVAADTFSSELGILSTSPPRLLTSLTLRQVPPGTNGGITPLGTAAGFLGSFIIALTSAVLLPFCPATPPPSVVGAAALKALTPGLQGGLAWGAREKVAWVLFVTAWGGLGSLLDSLLGGLLQRSIVDVRSGKVVEGVGGGKVLVRDHGRAGHGRVGETVRAGGTGREVGTKPSEGGVSKGGGAAEGEAELKGKPSRRVESGWDLLDNNGVNFLMALLMSGGGMVVAGWVWGVPPGSVMR